MLKKLLVLILSIVMLLVGACTVAQIKPVYEQFELNEPHSVLIIENRCSTGLFSNAPWIEVDIDGFRAMEKKHLPKDSVELRIMPGSHQITHLGIVKSATATHYEPITTMFKTEEGKTYKIIFEYYMESLVRYGYTITYEGWPEEHSSKWPQKSPIITIFS